MHVIKEEGRKPIKAWVDTRVETVYDIDFKPGPIGVGHLGEIEMRTKRVPNIEETALAQLRNMATLPFIHGNGIAVMPDVHAGIGATVGSVIATRKAVIPAAAGVDLGCGINAVRTSLKAPDLPDTLWHIRNAIEAAVPTGAGKGGEHRDNDVVYRKEVDLLYAFGRRGPVLPPSVESAFRNPEGLKKAGAQLGTLGGGNHFIEICLDEEQAVWVVLHSGSRGIGNIIGRHYIDKARRLMERFYIHLPDNDLAYLPDGTQEFNDYVEAVHWAQDYALLNRQHMMQAVLEQLRLHVKGFDITDEGVNCHHNYIAIENHFNENLYVTRKGAVRARAGDRVVIPGSMGQRSYIARGKGHPESYCSCSHGAGRVMSRTAARNAFRVEDLEAQTQGVECRKDAAILDEIPAAYKDIDQVMANQSDLVEIEHTLKQILCVKGA